MAQEVAASNTEHPALRGARFIVVGVLINLALAIIKGVAGILGNSYALIADAMESSLDVFQSIVVWSGLRIAARPPDKDHPYGHGKAEPIAAVAVSMGLLFGALVIAVQSIREIVASSTSPAPFTLIVLVVVIVAKETLFRVMSGVGAAIESTAVRSDAWHHRSDAITSAAAFVGIGIAVVGGKGYENADDWAALFACMIIAFNGFRLLRPAVGEVMDVAPDPAVEAQVREVAMTVAGVRSLHVCWVRKMGFEYFVDLHVKVDGSITVHDGHDVAHRVKDAVRFVNPRIRDVLIHIEPED
ncbi:MAG: cation diffusion facilitator family transporter [Candidatus Hydrogenedentes bacterium]|nr:cation diffusion facilitator family transporter [Candidatus Hydrogenedentota bacterium]